MKIKTTILISFFVILVFTSFLPKQSMANNEIFPTYNFYIKNNEMILKNTQSILFHESINEENMISKKIAPGTSGKFNVNINISNGVISKYNLKFTNFSEFFPKNLKFYFNGAEMDLKTFSLTDIQSSRKVSYEFTWEWEYETDDKSDLEDTFLSNIDNLSFDICLTAEYEEIEVEKTLPRSGDI